MERIKTGQPEKSGNAKGAPKRSAFTLTVFSGLIVFIACGLYRDAGSQLLPPEVSACKDERWFQAAKDLADQTAGEVVEGKLPTIYARFEREFHQIMRPDEFNATFNSLFAQFGKPLATRFMSGECGGKFYMSGISKPLWKFRYFLRTTKYEWGEYYLSVEVVLDKDRNSLTAVTFGKYFKNKKEFKEGQQPNAL